VVEDEPSTLRLLEKFLSLLKYNCLSADTPAKALDMARRRAEEISLLMTDVIMPGMNGRELSERLAGQIPKIKCIYMSGYTADEIDDQGVLEEGVHFIQKPFSRKDIAVKIRAVLDQNYDLS
jgi:DNA-binding response OmpR family regulator